jgi:DNA replication and repair protein RecF
MVIKELTLTQFKNYSRQQFNFNAKVNCIVGLNGAGKTNVLDAIYFLAFTKSYFNHLDTLAIQFEKKFFVIEAILEQQNLVQQIKLVQPLNEKKQLWFNNNPVKRLASHIGTLPLVMITPADILLPSLAADDRRKFIDGFIAQFNNNYLTELLNYNRTLEQRNKLLKDFYENNYTDITLLNSYNQQLVNSGNYIFNERKTFFKNIAPLFAQQYTNITSGNEFVELIYKSSLSEDSFESILIKHQQADLKACRTTQGIHKDDMLMQINGYSLKKIGSQGQQKSFIIALKLAMYAFLKEQTQKIPLLLLDDIFEKLDDVRIEKLLDLISGDFFGQIFITHTQQHVLQNLFKPKQIDATYFNIVNGQLA